MQSQIEEEIMEVNIDIQSDIEKKALLNKLYAHQLEMAKWSAKPIQLSEKLKKIKLGRPIQLEENEIGIGIPVCFD